MNYLVVIAEKEVLKLVEQLGYKDYPILITGVGALNIIEALKDIPIHLPHSQWITMSGTGTIK